MPPNGRTTRHDARRGWVALALFVGLTLPAPGARADDDHYMEGFGDYLFGISLSAIANIGGVVTIVGMVDDIGQRRRPGMGWLFTGGLFGVIEVGSGVGLLALDEGRNKGLLAYSIVTLAAGVTNVGLVIGGACMDERRRSPAAWITPLLLPDAGDGYAAGVGVSVVGF